MCNVSKGILQKGFERGMEQGMEQGIDRGMEQLSEAVIIARKNHISSIEELVEQGVSKKVAEAAIALL